jgi:predicted glycogen debranching enzyme
MNEVTRRIPWPGRSSLDLFLEREWLVTNGLGGYASGTIAGLATRRFHGLLIAALPAPFGRTMMLNELGERLRFSNGALVSLNVEADDSSERESSAARHLAEFRLEAGLPVWSYEIGDFVLEKHVLMLNRQNTVHVRYTLLSGPEPVLLDLRPAVYFRPHEDHFSHSLPAPYTLTITDDKYEITAPGDYPSLKLRLSGVESWMTLHQGKTRGRFYRTEARRGYDCEGVLWSPGYFTAKLEPGERATLIGSSESWPTILAMSPDEAVAAERERRERLLLAASAEARSGFPGELVLAADQFMIIPAGRIEEAARARASGDEVRTVIAGYHWFTDWGRDTMISLEGLSCATGRWPEAGSILRTFAHYVRDGLLPNVFPEGEREGLYHTADATLWFFHALNRYLETTGDRETLDTLLPVMGDIVAHHITGTRFGIGVDPTDGLLRQGAEGYQLTWMDAKVDGWVVTPRRGKAVEVNALWYNALRLLAKWVSEEDGASAASPLIDQAEQARHSFNARFWFAEGGYLFDVVDGENGNDPSCRPNQILAFSLAHPILNEDKWSSVLDVVSRNLLTPVGLRSLARGSPNYKPSYDGDLRSRDAAYHQGTVWAWLIGPFIDAWLRVNPEDSQGALRLLSGFERHVSEACIGSISEIFDAEEPFTPRGCIAQAWSIAEVLRTWIKASQPIATPKTDSQVDAAGAISGRGKDAIAE